MVGTSHPIDTRQLIGRNFKVVGHMGLLGLDLELTQTICENMLVTSDLFIQLRLRVDFAKQQICIDLHLVKRDSQGQLNNEFSYSKCKIDDDRMSITCILFLISYAYHNNMLFSCGNTIALKTTAWF